VEQTIKDVFAYLVGHVVVLHFSIAFALLIAIERAFKWSEETADEDSTLAAGYWLLEADKRTSEVRAEKFQSWPMVFAALFDRAFGQKHLFLEVLPPIRIGFDLHNHTLRTVPIPVPILSTNRGQEPLGRRSRDGAIEYRRT